jgi:hypothetical protein
LTSTPQPWLSRRRNQILVVVVIAVIAVSALVYFLPSAPATPDQVALNRTVAYFVDNYNFTVGLVSTTPRANTYYLYSDNYLASVALGRYDPTNQSTSSFSLAISEAVGSYASTLPGNAFVSEYKALNSTSASFSCGRPYLLTWTGSPPKNGTAIVETIANNGEGSCASLNNADTLLLQAVYFNNIGDSTTALSYFHRAAADFDGKGFADLAFTASNSTTAGQYQTYKLALYVYASTCLGQSGSDTDFQTIFGLMMRQLDNSTGGFYSGYAPSLGHGLAPTNTQTTALAALALEAVINPSADC